jgi:hypothetical protein
MTRVSKITKQMKERKRIDTAERERLHWSSMMITTWVGYIHC